MPLDVLQPRTGRECDVAKKRALREAAQDDNLDIATHPNIPVVTEIPKDRFLVSNHKEASSRAELAIVCVNPDLADSRTQKKSFINFWNQRNNSQLTQ
jgi:hypothetical protein